MRMSYKNTVIYYTVTGQGPAVVLLHGFLETSAMWEATVAELSAKHQVICIDLLGHGQTGCIGYVHTMTDMATAVSAVLKQLHVEQAEFVGHSMGGYVALALAEQRPELFKGLVLLNSTFEADTEERKTIRTRAIEMAKVNYKSLVQLSFANLFAPESKVRFRTEYKAALSLALQTSVQGYIAAQEGMMLRPDRFAILTQLPIKKALLTGSKDSLIDAEYIEAKIRTNDC